MHSPTLVASMLGTIIGGGKFIADGEPHAGLTMIDLDGDRKSARFIAMSFLPHAIVIDPADSSKAAVFEKQGPGACYADLRGGRVLGELRSPAGRHFYGHGAFDESGILYATESYIDDGYRGVLVKREPGTFREIGTVPTYGSAPHDCQLLDDKRTIVITNGGGNLRGGAAPSVTYVDLQTEKLLDKVTLSAPRFNAGHLSVSPNGDLALVSAPRDGLPGAGLGLGAVSLKPYGKPIQTMRKPGKVTNRMRGEALSVLHDCQRDTVFATHPDGNLMTAWSMENAKLKRKYEQFEQPRGICATLDGEYYVVSHSVGPSVALSFLSAATGELLPELQIQPSYISGSHLFAHAMPSVA